MIYKLLRIYFYFFFAGGICNAQVTNTSILDTSSIEIPGKLTLGAYIDGFYGYDFSQPKDGRSPYFVNYNQDNEIAINVALVDIKYQSSNVRARFVPAYGTYMEANYSGEPSFLRNFVEASVGCLLHKKKNIWIDGGIIGSPYTNESYVSRDHLVLTRSFGAENAPYFMNGVKLSIPVHKKVNFYAYLFNGWQIIQETNRQKSFGTQVEYRPNSKWLLNWNTYAGDQRSFTRPQNRMRYFSDAYAIYNPNGKLSATACIYAGLQQRKGSDDVFWYHGNVTGRYAITSKAALSARIEYFEDLSQAVIENINNAANGFSTWSGSLCFNYAYNKLLLLRLESRTFFSSKEIWKNKAENPAAHNQWIVAGFNIIY